MKELSSSKTIGGSIYTISGDGKLTILATGQHRVVQESKEALELLQWLYGHRDIFLSRVYSAGAPDWAQEGKTSLYDTDPYGLRWDEE